MCYYCDNAEKFRPSIERFARAYTFDLNFRANDYRRLSAQTQNIIERQIASCKGMDSIRFNREILAEVRDEDFHRV